MNSIEFKRTSNIFINSGIIALDYYLNECKEENHLGYTDFEFDLSKDTLVISCESQEKLFKLLYDLYYFMGKDVYDTATEKQLAKMDNVYYLQSDDVFKRFPKISTYGLTQLFTNNAQGNTSLPENTIKAAQLEKTNPELLKKIKDYFEENNLKMQSKLYFNEPYTKITRLEKIDVSFFEEGKQLCSLTGVKRKALVDITNTSAFISGLNSFESHLKTSNRKICWDAMFLSFFSPKLALYHYSGANSTLNVFLFNSDNLLNLKKLFQYNTSFFKDRELLKAENYRSNFRIHSLGSKNQEAYTEKNELAFMLIYTFANQFLDEEKEVSEVDDFDPFEVLGMDNIPISLIAFKADEFSSTIRPNAYETINNFKLLVRLIYHLERNGVSFNQLNQSLKILKPQEKSNANSFRLERQTRNSVYGKIIKNKSIADEIEYIFYECYKILVSSKGKEAYSIGYKNFKQLFLLLTLYESIIKNGGTHTMDKELQQKAINLGKSIGQGIINYGDDSKQVNARNGKSYIIALKKARTLEQFNDEIIRLQTKYSISISNDILAQIDKQNFNYIKQFAIISALNQLNSVLQTNKSNQDEKK